MRAKYDFDYSQAIRGKYYKRCIEKSNVVVLEPDVHKRFKNSSAVNKALRSLMRYERTQRRLMKKRSTRTHAKARAG